MGDDDRSDDLLTLEPLLEAVRQGVEGSGWHLSGLQKTTSHQFEGRWEGDETRSAYLFFHRPGSPDEVSVDVFLDETSRGLRGNLALVVDAPRLGDLPDVPELLTLLGRAASDVLPERYRTPLSVRVHLPRDGRPEAAEVEVRFKLHIPRTAIDAGASAVVALCGTVVRSFEELLGRAGARMLLPPGEPH